MSQQSGSIKQPNWSAMVLLSCCVGLSACSSSSNNDPADDDLLDLPTMPENLAASVNSSKEVELVWTASTDDGWIVGYDLYRNGTPIIERLDTLRYTDDNLEPATTYQYTVIAVDNEGNHSNPNEVQATTLDVQPLHRISTKTTISSYCDTCSISTLAMLISRTWQHFRTGLIRPTLVSRHWIQLKPTSHALMGVRLDSHRLSEPLTTVPIPGNLNFTIARTTRMYSTGSCCVNTDPARDPAAQRSHQRACQLTDSPGKFSIQAVWTSG